MRRMTAIPVRRNKGSTFMGYLYYHFCAGDLSRTWSTAEIERYLHACGLFPAHKLTSQNPFLDIGLLLIRSRDSFSSRDYDPQLTNYICIVTSEAAIGNAQVQTVLDGLAALLHTEMQEDW